VENTRFGSGECEDTFAAPGWRVRADVRVRLPSLKSAFSEGKFWARVLAAIFKAGGALPMSRARSLLAGTTASYPEATMESLPKFF